MGVNLVDFHDAELKRRTSGNFDDLHWLISPHIWTTLAADAGATLVVGNTSNGEAVLTTGAVAENEGAIKTTNSIFLIANNKPLMGECRMKYTENATNLANVAFGFADALGADLLLDAGAGPKVSFSGALIYKQKSSLLWKTISSIGAVQTISTSTGVPGGGVYQTQRIEIQPITSTTAEVKFFVDNIQLIDNSTGRPIKHTITYTGAAQMQMGAYVKSGGAGGEVATVDYLAWEQLR